MSSSSHSRDSVIKEQPASIPPPDSAPTSGHTGRRAVIRAKASHLYDKVTTRHGWLGDYDYAWLCMPTLPFSLPGRFKGKRRQVGPPFYSLDSELPIVVAMTTGLQHSLAMLAGLITPPIIFASSLALDGETSAYMISASLIGCGASRSLKHPLRLSFCAQVSSV